MRIFNKTTIVNQTIKTSIVVLLAVFSSFGLKAQLAASLAAATGNYGNGEEFCVDLIVDDFTDFYFVNFSIGWNPNILEFVSAEALDADGELNLTDANFFTNRIAEGLFTFNWEDPTEEGVTIRTRNLEDNYGIFRLCFRTSDQCGGFTKIDINEASETVLRAGAGNRNIGFTEDEVFDAEITVEGTPVTITASQVVANPEEVVCISITAEEFSDVEGVQYSLVWDTTILKFQNIDNINPDFPFLSTSAINTMNATDEGFIIFSWFTSSGGGVSVPDNTPMFDVCFQVVGEGGNSSPVQFSSEPRAIEIATSNEGSDACNLMNNGRVSVREQEGEVTIKAGSGAVKPGESICVDFSVRDFIAVNEMNFSINWDPDVLAFESIENLSLSNSGLGDFFTTNAATGFITFTWDDINGELKQDDEVIFSICFTAVGAVGSSTQISFSGEPQPILVSTTSTVNAGLNTRNGMVTILPPESLNLNIANATVSPNEEFCVDITAENFSEIVGLEFSLGWETTQIDFVSITNFGVDGLDESDFDLSNAASGFLSLDWSSTNAAGENLSDEEVLFSICFRANTSAQLGLCDAIFFNDFPDPIQAVTSNSGGNSIEVTDQGNDICIFDPGG
ncbi:MAG: cohesin domain-containing protein, partial [Bacteroidota bacterium]